MSLYKRGRVWWTEFTVRGHRVRESTGTASRAKAEAYERKRRDDIHEQTVLGRTREMTFGEAADLYFQTRIKPKAKRRDGTPSNAATLETACLRLLESHFGTEAPVSRVASPAAVSGFNRALLATRKANTANRYLSLLRAVLNVAYDAGGLSKRPDIKATKINDERERFLSDAEEEALLAACPDHLRRLVTFILDTGARKQEALGLTWDRVNLERARPLVTFVETKSGKPRSVPLPKRTATMLRELWGKLWEAGGGDGRGRVFLRTPPGSSVPVPFDNPKKAWETARKKAGLDGLRIHDLRHTYASKCLRRNVSLFDVQKLLGHGNVRMTQRYAHLAPDHLDRAVAALD